MLDRRGARLRPASASRFRRRRRAALMLWLAAALVLLVFRRDPLPPDAMTR
jgi:hypothetical protein